MLTKKQHELLIFINKWLENHGVSPSFDEMKEALGLKSKSGIHRLITGLEEREFIRRLPHRARALEVLRLPDDVSISPGQKFSPRIIQGGVKNIINDTTSVEKPSIQLPILGKIAAGTPIEALSNPTNSIGVPTNLIGKGEYYCLEVEDNLQNCQNRASEEISGSISDYSCVQLYECPPGDQLCMPYQFDSYLADIGANSIFN